MIDDKKLLQEATRNYRTAVRHQQKWKRDAKKAFRFMAGDQLSAEDKQKLEGEKRPIVTFNMIGPNVEAVVGIQRANRTEIRFAAFEGAAPEEQSFADWANSLLKKSDEDSDSEMEVSEAFRDAVICGLGWTQRTIDYDNDPRGTLAKRNIDPLRKWYDPSARRHNLIDRKYDFTEVFLDKWEFEALFPDAVGKKAEADDATTNDQSPWSVGGKETEVFDGDVEQEESQDAYGGEDASTDGEGRLKDKVRVIEYNYWRWEPVHQVLRAEGQDEMIPDDEWPEFAASLAQQGFTAIEATADATPALNNPTVVFWKRTHQKVHYRAQFRGSLVLSHEVNINPCDFNEHAITCSFDRATGLFYGIVRSMLDPQLWSNKVFMQLMLVVMSSPKGGVFFKKGAFANPEKVRQDYATAAPMIETVLKEGETFANVLQDRAPAPYPTGLHELLTYCSSVIPRVTGINMELLGLAQKDQPGILEHLRQQAGMTILASLFDSLRAYHKLDGRTALYLMRHEIPMQRQMEILGKTNAPLAQLVAQLPPNLDRFLVNVEEAPYSPNRKFLVFKMLTDLGTTNPELQSLIFPALLDYTPLPQAAVENIRKAQAENSEAQQAQQQAGAQMQAGQIIAKIKEMLAHAELYEAQAQQTEASIANRDVETVSQVAVEKADAMAKLAAAAKPDAPSGPDGKHPLDALKMGHDMMMKEREVRVKEQDAMTKARVAMKPTPKPTTK